LHRLRLAISHRPFTRILRRSLPPIRHVHIPLRPLAFLVSPEVIEQAAALVADAVKRLRELAMTAIYAA
jgi:hypothetical protein